MYFNSYHYVCWIYLESSLIVILFLEWVSEWVSEWGSDGYSTPNEHFFSYSRWVSCRITVTRRVLHGEQELWPFRSTWVHPWVRVVRSLVFCVLFCTYLFIVLSLFFWPLYCLSSSIHGFWLLIWYLQSFIMRSSDMSMRWRWLCIRPTCLVEFYGASSISLRVDVNRSTRTHYPDAEPTSLWSYYLMLRT